MGDAGPSCLERTSVAGPSGLASAGWEETGAGSGSDSDLCLKTSQDILGKFVEDWLETLDKEEVKSASWFFN